MHSRPLAPLLAATMLLPLAACGGGSPEPSVEAGAPEEVVVEAAEQPGAQAIERDPAPAVEAVTERATAEADETWQALEANWEDALPRVKAEFTELDETRLHGTGGERGAVVALIIDSYGIEPVEAERRLAEWEATL